MARSQARMESVWAGAFRFALLGLGTGVAGALGLGGTIWLLSGRVPVALFVGFPVGGFVGGFAIGLVAREGVGGLVAFATGGGRGHTRPEFSHAQALVIRGAYRDALLEYERAVAEDPTDPEPLILGARVLRDNLADGEGAAEWFRRAARVPSIPQQAEITIVRELTELYTRRLDTPARALPDLARIAEKYRGTQAGEWAARRLVQLRAGVWEDVKGETEPSGG